ncbi:MAG: hypothetical protein KGI50_05135 [Patescibacteria group bacterium]|nr:hypothetical protein [Patescibacteria group bacterium]MDE2438703.1 hypothetical protein [Patescibacteria group bacterium]
MDKTEGFKKFLYNQVALAAAIIGVAFGIFNLLQAPREDIKVIDALNNIRDNHIHTIEENLKRLDETHQQQFLDTSDRLTKIETILEERLPAKK